MAIGIHNNKYVKRHTIKTETGKTYVYYKDPGEIMSPLEPYIEKIEFYRNGELKPFRVLSKYTYSLSKNEKYVLGTFPTEDGGWKNDIYKINGDLLFVKKFDKSFVDRNNRDFPEKQETGGRGFIDNNGCISILIRPKSDYNNEKDVVYCKDDNQDVIGYDDLGGKKYTKIHTIKTETGKTYVYYKPPSQWLGFPDKIIERIEFYRNGELKPFRVLSKNYYELSNNEKYVLGTFLMDNGRRKNDIYKINGDLLFVKKFDKEFVEELNEYYPAKQEASYPNILDNGCISVCTCMNNNKPCKVGCKEEVFCKK